MSVIKQIYIHQVNCPIFSAFYEGISTFNRKLKIGFYFVKIGFRYLYIHCKGFGIYIVFFQ